MRHDESSFGMSNGQIFRERGEPLSVGDEVVIGGDVFALELEPSAENFEGFLIKSWAIQTDEGWFAIGEIFPPELRRDH